MQNIFVFIFIFLSNFSFSLDKSSQNIINNNYLTLDLKVLNYIRKIISCFTDNSDAGETNWFLITKCMINETKGKEKELRDSLKTLSEYRGLIDLALDIFDTDGIIKKIVDFFIAKARNESVLIDNIFSLINRSDSTGAHLLDHIYEIVDKLEHNQLSNQFILKNISSIIRKFDAYEFYSRIRNNSKGFVIDLVEYFLNRTDSKAIHELIKNKSVGKLLDDIIFLFIDITVNFIDEAQTLRIIGDFLYSHTELLNLFKKVLLIDRVKKIIKEYFIYEDPLIKAIIDTVLEGGKECDLLFELFSNRTLIKGGEEIIINLSRNKDKKYVENNLGPYLKNVSDANKTYINNVVKSFMYIGKKLMTQEEFLNEVIKAGQNAFLEFFRKNNLTFNDVSPDCLELFKVIFFNEDFSWKSIFFRYLKKFLFDSPRNKDDFLDFDNCMDVTSTAIIIQNNITY